MGEQIELETAWWPGENELWAQVGGEVKRIWIEADGQGLSGYYDRIHILKTDGTHNIAPAHHCQGWTLKERDES